MNSKETAEKAFQNLLKVFNIERTEFRGSIAYKFETNDLAELLAGLTECHDKLYRIILTTAISTHSQDERIEAIKNLREFTNYYLDRSTSELIEAHNNGETISKTFGIVK